MSFRKGLQVGIVLFMMSSLLYSEESEIETNGASLNKSTSNEVKALPAIISYLLSDSTPKHTVSCIVGTWTTSYDWGCDGSPETAYVYYRADGSFGYTDSTGDHLVAGFWTISGNTVKQILDGGTTYTGTVNADCNYVSGYMDSTVNPDTGCWHSSKTSNSAPVTSDSIATTENDINTVNDALDYSGN